MSSGINIFDIEPYFDGHKEYINILDKVSEVRALLSTISREYMNSSLTPQEIAKWNFKVNEASEEFTTIKLADTYDEDTLLNGKIAPGTSGSFDLVIDASDAEVGVDYKVDFLNETNKPTNLIRCNCNRYTSCSN